MTVLPEFACGSLAGMTVALTLGKVLLAAATVPLVVAFKWFAETAEAAMRIEMIAENCIVIVIVIVVC